MSHTDDVIDQAWMVRKFTDDKKALDWWFNWTIDQLIANSNFEGEIQQVLYSLLLLNPWRVEDDGS